MKAQQQSVRRLLNYGYLATGTGGMTAGFFGLVLSYYERSAQDNYLFTAVCSSAILGIGVKNFVAYCDTRHDSLKRSYHQ